MICGNTSRELWNITARKRALFDIMGKGFEVLTLQKMANEERAPAFGAGKVSGVSRASRVKLPGFDGQRHLLGSLDYLLEFFGVGRMEYAPYC